MIHDPITEAVALRQQRISKRRVAELLGLHPSKVGRLTRGVCPRESSTAMLEPVLVELAQAHVICGYSFKETGRRLEISNSTVRHHAGHLAAFRAYPDRISRVSPTQVAEWRRLVASGKNREDIAAEASVQTRKVSAHCRDLQTRNHSARHDHAKIRELLASGLGPTAVAAKVGCSKRTVFYVKGEA